MTLGKVLVERDRRRKLLRKAEGGKYLRRLGTPGNYRYVYEEPKGREKGSSDEEKKPQGSSIPGLVKKPDGFWYDGTAKVTKDDAKAKEYSERKAKEEKGHSTPPIKQGEQVRIKSSAKGSLGRGVMGKIKEIGDNFVRILTDEGKMFRVPREALEFARSRKDDGIPLIKAISLKAQDIQDDEFDPWQLATGIRMEMSEHTDDPELAKGIAKGHLVEDPEYYTKLIIFEDVRQKKGMQKRILEWFKQNPNPKDVKVHKLASQCKMDPAKFEEQLYKLMSEYAKLF